MDPASVLFLPLLLPITLNMMMLRRWAVGPSVNNSFPEHISESTCRIVFKFYTQHL